LAASCAVGPDYVRPEAPRTKGYSVQPTPSTTATAAGAAQRIEVSDHLAADWWRLFGCRPLDGIVGEALAHSPTIEAALATLRGSEDSLRAGYGVFFPQVDAAGNGGRQRFSPVRFGSTVPPSVFNLFTLSGSVGYTLDIWGGQRRNVENLKAQVEAQRYTAIGSYLILSSNVVDAVIAAAAYRAQIDATKELIALEEDQVRIGKAQAEAGTAPYANVLALESQVALARATLPPLEQKIDQAKHLIAMLTGRSPGEWSPPSVALADLTLPAEIPLSLPSQLVRQRPDVLVAEAQLHSANAQIGVATAAMLPNLTLSGSVGTNAVVPSDLFVPGSVFWSVLGGVTQPIFHGGTLAYQRKAAMDARDQALANYRQTVLTAFQQVADSLAALGHDADAVNAQAEAAKASQTALHLLQINYKSGVVDYLQVLTANAQYLQSRVGLVQAQAQRLQDTVALFVALGGGWWNAPPSTRLLDIASPHFGSRKKRTEFPRHASFSRMPASRGRRPTPTSDVLASSSRPSFRLWSERLWLRAAVYVDAVATDACPSQRRESLGQSLVVAVLGCRRGELSSGAAQDGLLREEFSRKSQLTRFPHRFTCARDDLFVRDSTGERPDGRSIEQDHSTNQVRHGFAMLMHPSGELGARLGRNVFRGR
jgi:NodT family efflux transporter outer membrane factor (OMF) lipoprotein